jgi:predicted dehydrogenase
MKNKTKQVTRREFLGLSALGLAGLTILPSWSQNGVRIPPSDRVVLGFIGLGRQAIGDFHSFTNCPGVQVAAGCDVDTMKNDRFRRMVTEWQRTQNMPERCDTYDFYERMLDRKDIDAVVIGTPDHWHALNIIHSAQAKKDIFIQKPLAYNISESLACVQAVRQNNVMCQIGSQQRSDREFKTAVALVRSGKLGAIKEVHVRVGEHPEPFGLPEERVPNNLNFNKWLGPLNFPVVHYNSRMCPVIGPPDYRERGEWAVWRYYKETGNGFIGDWGAHHFDIAQQALGMDGLGPQEFIPAGYGGAQHDTQKYANGIVMQERPFRTDRPDDKGINFIGTNASLQVARGYIVCSDPSLLDISMDGGNDDSVAQLSAGHMQDFINTVRSRREPIAPVEAGASTNILFCNINIAHELKRPVKWDPVTKRFFNDKEAEAHRLYFYEYRNPYKLPYWRG